MTTHNGDNDSTVGREASEASYTEWEDYWRSVSTNRNKNDGIAGDPNHWASPPNANGNGDVAQAKNETSNSSSGVHRRWFFAMRHAERVDLTFGKWVPHCFREDGAYVRRDLNMPVTLADRAGGKEAYAKDSPLTRVGRLQAYLVGEGLRLAGVPVKHIYTSPALRCVETAIAFVQGLQADESVKIRVEPGLFEYKVWYAHGGLGTFMTPAELSAAGHNIDLNYTPYMENDYDVKETLEVFNQRYEKVIQSAVWDTEEEGGNVMFVGHAVTIDLMAISLKRIGEKKTDHPPYQITASLIRVPYCALGAVRDSPWEVVQPPCPPAVNSSSGRYDWRSLLELK